MCAKKSTTHIAEIIGYTIPVYHEGKTSYVDFYAFDSAECKIRRKKYHLDKIGPKRSRQVYARFLIHELTTKLSTGWRPWNSQSGTDRGFTPLNECLDRYLERIRGCGRKRTINTYSSKVKILKDYFKTLKNPPKYINELKREIVIDFLDWLLLFRKVGPRTRNNYRNWLNVLFEYLIERKYVSDNPTIGIDKLKEKVKHRKPLTESMLKEVTEYLNKSDKDFLLAVKLEYYAFIRPKELRLIKIKDISIKNQSIYIDGEISKNGRSSSVALNDSIINTMLDTGCLTAPIDYYLFGKSFKPSSKPCPVNSFNKRWAKVRKAMKWSDEYQFYSLKDSGIRDLANNAGIVYAKRQARHTDISTTNKYLQGDDMPLPEEVKHFKGNI